MSRTVYVEAFDKDDKEILGNLDGQGVIVASEYTRTKRYKNLWGTLYKMEQARKEKRKLMSRLAYYKIVTAQGKVLEEVRV